MWPVWYKKRTYPHFDLPMPHKDAQALATDTARVSQHSFFPFLAFDISQRRFRSADTGFKVDKKTRPIRVAAHRDGYIFAYYAHIISELHEQTIRASKFGDCVLAYRRDIGSNITFSKNAFDEVDRRGKCSAIAIDIEKFFDSIDDRALKNRWAELLGQKKLPNDHYKIFRAVTRYSWVNRDTCFEQLSINPKKNIPRPICTAKEFREQIRGAELVEVNKHDYGIPQGSQMSSILSNIYMLPFDAAMNDLALSIGGYYRRYSDDILWIVDPKYSELVQKQSGLELKKLGPQISINDDKTVISEFDDSGVLKKGSPALQYLGFTYDGQRRLIRSQTLSRFWRRATYAIRAAKNRARRAAKEGGNGSVFRRKIYRNFTHLGKRNFLSYVQRSQKIMESDAIRRQMKNHWNRIQAEFKRRD